MAFDAEEFAAKVSLGAYLHEELPGLAQDALQAGFDGPKLLRLAVLERPTGWETDQLIDGVLEELGFQRVTKESAAIRLAQIKAKAILTLEADPLSHLAYFHALYVRSEFSRALLRLAYVGDELDWDAEDKVRLEAEIRADAVDALREILALDMN